MSGVSDARGRREQDRDRSDRHDRREDRDRGRDRSGDGRRDARRDSDRSGDGWRDARRDRWDRSRSRDHSRRASPSYAPAPVAGPPIRLGFDGGPPLGLPPWQPKEERKRRDERPNSNSNNLEERRQQREAAEVDIWPPSPTQPTGSPEPVKSTKRRSRRYASETDDSEDEYERRRRRRKRRERRERERERERSASLTRVEHDEPEVGPVAPAEYDVQVDRDAYARLLPGEGAAMAAFVQKGERIPRRGEIGLDPAKIASYEAAGFVMSGSRHQRMNAVRQRKEAQVVSAEEKRAALVAQRDQAQAREGAIISQFREMVDERLQVEERLDRERERERERERDRRR
ncbi:uncharacterized protein CcaverHIS019_0111620 [Cutaneotrichosporon cavernicola]|uniref:NF-kappa-B-activating protein C-terminal domain-containing protein n=1 Tax=Cutaneotrichosporon cavernicola TaxID=279322 RepID=A0AA48KXM6_9TREE|nr:uncharacterized protein CcaverHIS019_0111620 [Cutaneotrichosporon cavernicola]BEI88444.1 hypothetical protein CcaverHIS019_0111620 [Cutaneotrichosporon cavernicola]